MHRGDGQRGSRLPFPRGRGNGRLRALVLCLAALSGAGILAAATSTAGAADIAESFVSNGRCLTGTWVVPHGVTQIDVQAMGAVGGDGDGFDTYNLNGDLVSHQNGGQGGWGSKVVTRITGLTPGQTLYVGVANPLNQPNAIPGGKGDNSGAGTSSGDGGAASWISVAPPTGPGCQLDHRWVIVVAAGGGGGGGATSVRNVNGGAGGTEAYGGNGGDGGGGDFSNSGAGGNYSFVTENAQAQIVGTAGGGGNGGHSFNCTSGASGDAGALFGDPQRTISPPASAGGAAGSYDGSVGIPDCSIPPSSRDATLQRIGGSGGGGGGGLYSGGGGGGSDDSGSGGGGGGASGTSFAKFNIGYQVSRWTGGPEIDIQSVTTPPAITSPDHATFTAGTPGSFTVTATGVDTPYVYFPDFDSLQRIGLDYTSATYPDGSGAGSATISGNPTRGGVYGATVRACNSLECASQSFTLTVDQAPGFGGASNFLFAQNQQNSVTIGTSGYPAPAITASNGPSWLTVTDNGDGTATLSGIPPPGTSPNTYTVDLTASNGIGADAHETVTFTIVNSLSMSPTSTHLVPGFSFDVMRVNPDLFAYQRDSQQQFTVTGTRPDGSTFDATSDALWSSSNSAAVSVNGSGFATAQALGTATLTAGTYGALNATASVVSAVPLSITVTPGTANIVALHTQQFTAMGCYADPCSSNSFDITSHVNWSVAPDDGTLHISDSGLAYAGNGGGPAVSVVATQFTSASPFETNGYSTVTVTHGDVTSIDLNPSGTTTITTNALETYGATVHYQDGTQSSAAYLNWSEQDLTGLNVAYVGQNIGTTSQIVSLHTGTARITASYANPDGTTVSASATLKVITVPQRLTITGCGNGLLTTSGQPLIPKAQSCQLTATATLNDGTDVDVTNGVTWTSTNPSAFTISSTGLLTATGSQEGALSGVSASYTYTSTNNVQATISSAVLDPEVTLLPPVSLAITPTSLSTMHPNGQQQFTATATYADGSTVDLTHATSNLTGYLTQTQWSVDSDVADSVSGGLLHITPTSHAAICTVQSPCTLHVQAWIPPVGNNPAVYSNTVTVTVTDPLDHISLTGPGSYTTTAGQPTGPIHVEGWDAFGHDLGDVTGDSTLSVLTSDGSPDPSATCTSGSAVTCTATDADTGNGSTFHTIVATDPNAAVPLSTNAPTPSQVDLVVNHAAVDHVTVTGGSRTIYAGQDTRPFVVTAYDQYANSWDVTGFTVFSIAPSEHVQFGGNDYFSSCDTPTWATCRAYVVGQHTISAVYHQGLSDEQDVTLPLYVGPSLGATQITLSGGPSGEVAVGAATPAYSASLTDLYGNSGVGTNVELSISPDGSCDETTETCVPAAAGRHTVQAQAFDRNGNPVLSNALTFNAVTPDHLALDGGSGSIGVGESTEPYIVEAFDASNRPLGDVTSQSTFSISPDGSCDSAAATCTASVADSGGSSHTVTATYTGGGGATGTASLVVEGVDHIQLVGDTSPLVAGDSTPPFRVEGFAADNTDLGTVTSDVTLSISPDGTCDQTARTCSATTADTNGSEHTITATYNGDGNPTSSVQVEVDPSPIVASLELLGGSSSISAGDTTAPYQAEGLDPYGNPNGDETPFVILTIGPNEPGASCDDVLLTCTATVADTNGSQHTVTAIIPGNGGTIRGSAGLTVNPGPTASLTLSGGSDSVEAGLPTNPYSVGGQDAYGNDTGDVTAESTLSISPDGSCEQDTDTCTADSTDSASLGTRHTITATDGPATGTSTVFVTPNAAPFPFNFGPFLDDPSQQYNQNGDFVLDYPYTQDPNHDPLTYTLQQKSSVPGSQWTSFASGLQCPIGHDCSYTFGGANPPEEQGTWTYRVLVTDGFSVVTSPESDPVYVDDIPPATTDDVSSFWTNDPSGQQVVTLTADDGNGSGVYATYYQVAPAGTPTPSLPADPSFPAVNDPSGEWFYYWAGDQPYVNDGDVVFYYSVDNAGNVEPVETSNAAHIDNQTPVTTDDVPLSRVNQNVTVTLDAQDRGDSGVAFTYYEIGQPGDTPDPTLSSPVYDPNNKPVLENGEEIKYFSVDNAGNAEQVETSPVAQVRLPTSQGAPYLSGTTQDGQLLKVSFGSWSSPDHLLYTYQWQRCDQNDVCTSFPVPGAWYRLTSADVGDTIRVTVTATDQEGLSGQATTPPTGVVAAPPAPSNTVSPSLTGTPQDGQLVKASFGSWSSPDKLAIGYQWQRCDASSVCTSFNVAAPGVWYRLTSADVGDTIQVVVTATDQEGQSTQVTTTATGVVAGPAPPSTIGSPTILGTPQDGQFLKATLGSWSSPDRLTYAYQWQRCDSSGGNCSAPLATTQTYRLTSADVGSTYLLTITATDQEGQSGTATVLSGVVGNPPAPSANGAPAISGTVQDGQSVKASTGSWSSPDKLSYGYQWQRCDHNNVCTNVSAAGSGVWYKLTSADVGDTIQVVVTATDLEGQSGQATSAATGVVAAPASPSNSLLPSLSGASQDGQLLKASAGSWSSPDKLSYGYQWQRCNPSNVCTSFSVAGSGVWYKLTPADVGDTIRVIVTATDQEGQATTATSAATGTVAAPPAPLDVTLPSVSGLPQNGQLLKASTGAWSSADKLSYGYQWQRCNPSNVCTSFNVSGSGVWYKLTPADVGDTIRVIVTATDQEGQATQATSTALGPVTP
jgi:hypothetical protein